MTARSSIPAAGATVHQLRSGKPKQGQRIVDAGSVVHDRVPERRTVSKVTAWGEPRDVVQLRWVCSCGWVSAWHRRHLVADRKAAGHGVSGQLSFVMA